MKSCFNTMKAIRTNIHPQPAARVAKSVKDIWSMVNEAAAECSQPPVNLGQGFMNFGPEENLIKEATKCMNDPLIQQYSHTRGRSRLLKAISESYSPLFGRTLDPKSEIVVTAGANEGMFSAFAAFLEPGDEVILFEPFFDQYVDPPKYFGAKLVYVPLYPPKDADLKTVSASQWKISIDELRSSITPRTKMMVLNSPWNPVGKIFSRDELLEIGKLAVEHNIVILSDEVYDSLYYVPFYRIATLSPELSSRTITVGSAGKIFNATGWRIGWLIGEPHLIKPAAAAHTRITFTVNSPLQEAVAAGFEQSASTGYFERTVSQYKDRVDKFTAVLDEIGLPYTIPEGGYFVLVNFSTVKMPSDYPVPEEWSRDRGRDFRLAYWLLKEFGVVAIPPTEFYSKSHAHLGENFLRFAVCKTDDVLNEAVARLRKLNDYVDRSNKY